MSWFVKRIFGRAVGWLVGRLVDKLVRRTDETWKNMTMVMTNREFSSGAYKSKVSLRTMSVRQNVKSQ